MDSRILHECCELAFQNKITFPESVKRMAAAGVERYCADLVRLEKFHYSPEGEDHVVPMPLKNAPAIAQNFSSELVSAAIGSIQRGEIDYAEFLRRIMAAGVVYYDVFIFGAKAIYTGRKGDFHVESFPGK